MLYPGAEALVCPLPAVWQAFCTLLHFALESNDPAPQQEPALVEVSSTAC